MQTNLIPDFSKFSNDPFTPKQTRQLNYLNAVTLVLGCCCMIYWYYLTKGDMLRKIDIYSESRMEELLVSLGTVYLLLKSISGLISFQLIRPMSLRKQWFIMWVSMILSSIIIGLVVFQKV
ncbi:hypothetical protein Runsl_1542 [Runella slithyformis DSM 19594]|uniref:Uncharacterized protein n=1 Tax=Runella slithyformis (strain ATCC 29530 / DSM 19594 / LMG 11500 / NCIMB 11436 / LSU 4) TaxID=761193 RepID=A0A7U3ZIS3_RUNSL|nr:hypothetical protein Runsl_1542 [Runella slithyformis DSM 19594]